MIHATAESEKVNILKLGWNNNVHVIGTHSENSGIVVTEAPACGTPVITTWWLMG